MSAIGGFFYLPHPYRRIIAILNWILVVNFHYFSQFDMTNKQDNKKKNQAAVNSAKRSAPQPAVFVSPKRNKMDSTTTDTRDAISLRIMGKVKQDGKMEEGAGNVAIAVMDNGRRPGDDGFWPYTTGLAKDGDGAYKAENKKAGTSKVITMKNLLDINVVDSGYRRQSQDNNVILRNVSVDEKNNKQWGRKYLLIVAAQEMNDDLWTAVLVKILQVSKFLSLHSNHSVL